MHNNNNNNASNVTPPSPESAASKMSTKDVPSDEDDENEEYEEFFDIADDPLTDEELDNKSDNNNNLETQSLALRSCYGSINDLNEVNNKQTTSAAAAAATVTLPITKSQLDFDKNGWRLVKYIFKILII